MAKTQKPHPFLEATGLTEKQFYDSFPDEDSFFKKYPEMRFGGTTKLKQTVASSRDANKYPTPKKELNKVMPIIKALNGLTDDGDSWARPAPPVSIDYSKGQGSYHHPGINYGQGKQNVVKSQPTQQTHSISPDDMQSNLMLLDPNQNYPDPWQANPTPNKEESQIDDTQDNNSRSFQFKHSWTPNSMNDGNRLNWDIPNGIADTIGLSNILMPNTKLNNNLNPLQYTYNQNPQGTGSHAIFEDGGELEAKSGIHIKPSHKGRFTAYKKRTGKTTEQALHSKNARVRKMAQFAKNTKYWKKGDNGLEIDQDDEDYDAQAMNGIRMLGDGNLSQISANPYSKPIMKYTGPSHDEGGIPIAMNGNKVEVEGEETQYDNTVLGNMKLPKIGNVNIDGFTGKKFKSIGEAIAENERHTMTLDKKADNLLKTSDPGNKYQTTAINTANVLKDGVSQNFKAQTIQKEMLTRIQQGLLDYAKYNNIEPQKLHQEFAKYGKTIKAQSGFRFDKNEDTNVGAMPDFTISRNRFDPRELKNSDFFPQVEQQDMSHSSNQKMKQIPQMGMKDINTQTYTSVPGTGMRDMPIDYSKALFQKQIAESDIPRNPMSAWTEPRNGYSLADENTLGLHDFLPAAKYVLEQPDPVQVQQYNPNLLSAYNVSFQDRLNNNQSTFNSLVKQAPNNLAALASIAGNKYAADNAVNTEEFRTNQGLLNGINNQNVQNENEAQRFNIGLKDQQQDRQARAKAVTDSHKAQGLAYIADMIDKNRYENRNIRLVEERSGYRLNDEGKLVWMGPNAQFNMQGQGKVGSPYEETQEFDSEGNLIKTMKKTKSQNYSSSKFGGFFPKTK